MTSPSENQKELLSRSLSSADLPDPQRSLALLAEAQAGDRAALEELVTRYQDRIRRIVRIQLGSSIVGQRFDSMDIVQNTFRAALPKIADLRPRSSAGLLQWLALIAKNQIRDAYDGLSAAKRDIAREVPIASGDGSSAPGFPLASPGAPPEQQAQLSEIRELLDDAVAELPERQRRVVLLRDYCGEQWDQIAAELGRDNGAARQLHQRAWIHLRRELRPKIEGFEPD